MKSFFLVTFLAIFSVLVTIDSTAQIKGPRDYFPKNYQPPTNRIPAYNRPPPNTARTPGQQPAAKVQPPKFRDIATNTLFFFASDTNRTVGWTKVSATTAKNNKTSAVAPINGLTVIQR